MYRNMLHFFLAYLTFYNKIKKQRNNVTKKNIFLEYFFPDYIRLRKKNVEKKFMEK